MWSLPQLQRVAPLPASALGFCSALLLTGCISSELVPAGMESQITRDTPFESLKAEPDKFKGRVIVLGGKVLAA